MKKIIAAALIAAMLTTTLSGCKDAENPSQSSSSSNGSSSANGGDASSDKPADSDSGASSDATSSDGSGAGTGSEASTGSSAVDRMDKVFKSFTQYFAPGDGMVMVLGVPDADAVAAKYPMPDYDKNPDAVMTHCVGMVQSGEEILPMMGLDGLDLNDCEDYAFTMPLMSALIKKVVIVKPKSDKKDAVKTVLTSYAEAEKLPNPMEYPSWEAERAGTVMGETSDGYIYVVVAEDGAEFGKVISQ